MTFCIIFPVARFTADLDWLCFYFSGIFWQEMCLVFPNCQRVNRGNHVVSQLVDACRANNVTDLIMLHEHRGEPGKIPRLSASGVGHVRQIVLSVFVAVYCQCCATL